MATIGTNAVTLSDWLKTRNPDGSIATVIEIIKKKNKMLDDMLWLEGNLPTGHKTTIRTGYPSSTWRMLNYGVQTTKGTNAQVTDTCGMLEQYGEVDEDLLELSGTGVQFRMTEDKAHIEGISKDLATALIYSNQATDPSQITGLAPRYNSISTDPDLIGYNVVSAAGSGSDNTSIFMVGWGDDAVAGIYPKGSQAGLRVRDLGRETKTDAAGGLMQVFRTHYQWKPGLSVRNWKYAGRICNIDVSDLTSDASAGANLLDLMVTLFYRLEDQDRTVPIYCNRTILEFFHKQAMNKSNVNLTIDEAFGKPVVKFLGNPIRRVDAIVNTESVVS